MNSNWRYACGFNSELLNPEKGSGLESKNILPELNISDKLEKVFHF
jgi:hypothetical protein